MTALFVAAIGDSVMWGQGLAREDKFAFLVAKRIAAIVGKTPSVLLKAHGGATITASQQMRLNFVDTFPHLFLTLEQRERFLAESETERDEIRASGLSGEINEPFPTIRFQVMGTQDDAAKNIDVVLLNGGANDLGFRDLIVAEEFVSSFDQDFERIFYRDFHNLLRLTREKFPNALIIVTGYYSGFSAASDRDQMKDMFLTLKNFKHLYTIATFITPLLVLLFANDAVSKALKIAQAASEYGESRGLYWMRRSVTEMTEDPGLKALAPPGIIFVAPSFRPENCMFAPQSLIHQRYEPPLEDDARDARRAACPRIDKLGKMRQLKAKILRLQNDNEVANNELAGLARELEAELDGPLTLKATLPELASKLEAQHASFFELQNLKFQVLRLLESEIDRIEITLIASVIHPNPQGAAQIAAMVERKWKLWHSLSVRERLTKCLPPAQRVNPPPSLSVSSLLHRFGFDPAVGLRGCLAHVEPDVLSLVVATHVTSSALFTASVFLNLGEGGRWELRHLPMRILAQVEVNPHFGRASRDLFTIDVARQIAIGDITHAVIEIDQHIAPVTWQPERVTLSIDGGHDIIDEFFGVPPEVRNSLDLRFPH